MGALSYIRTPSTPGIGGRLVSIVRLKRRDHASYSRIFFGKDDLHTSKLEPRIAEG